MKVDNQERENRLREKRIDLQTQIKNRYVQEKLQIQEDFELRKI